MQITSLVDNTNQRLALVRLGEILPVETDRYHGSDRSRVTMGVVHCNAAYPEQDGADFCFRFAMRSSSGVSDRLVHGDQRRDRICRTYERYGF